MEMHLLHKDNAGAIGNRRLKVPAETRLVFPLKSPLPIG